MALLIGGACDGSSIEIERSKHTLRIPKYKLADKLTPSNAAPRYETNEVHTYLAIWQGRCVTYYRSEDITDETALSVMWTSHCIAGSKQ